MLHKDGLAVLYVGLLCLISVGYLFIDLEEEIEKVCFILISKKIFQDYHLWYYYYHLQS